MAEDRGDARGVRFGVFDHVDASGLPLADHYEARLKLAELYDALGFRGYHVAEHHATPLGTAPSPSVLLSAIAQRTRRLRLGPLIYMLPIHHPLRLIEEVCMLDQLSRGRLMLGVGRGVSPIEMGFYGVDAAAESADRYRETLEILLKGLQSERLTHEGRFHSFRDVPMTVRPYQQPLPELWYGAGSADSARWAAANGVNVVTLAPAAQANVVTQTFREEWARLGNPATRRPFAGLSRHIVVADSEAQAKAIAARAYDRWQANFYHLWDEAGISVPRRGLNPQGWETMEGIGTVCAGTAETVRAYVAGQVAETGADYFVIAFAFGDMTFDEAARSARLFAEQVMPAFAAG